MNSSEISCVVLAILDGWGIAQKGIGNAISQASIPNMDKFMFSYPNTELSAAGSAVGLPRGEDGNSETGHLNIGAGRIVYQELERINMAIADGNFFKKEVLIGAIEHAKRKNSNLHLMGLIGAGGVHSNIEHLFALIQLASKNKFDRVFLHLFTDGRDSPPTAAKTYIKQVNDTVQREGVGKVASVMGRYWAMDRDLRWDRTKKAYFALTKGNAVYVKSAEEAVNKSYSKGITDEFIEPSLIVNDKGNPVKLIKENDAVIFFNFRIDRPRQLTKAFIFEDFKKASVFWDYDPHLPKYQKENSLRKIKKEEPFVRGKFLNNLYFATMTEYGKSITQEGAKPAFPPEIIVNPISAVISSHGLPQLKITESEKERFVTYYFNGLTEAPFLKEEKLIIPSPKVKTYDQKPEMATEELTNKLLNRLALNKYRLIVVNYPNVDVVAHSGDIKPTIKACETVDWSLGKIADYILIHNCALIITADHGNAEEMINVQTDEVDTEHSANPVPFVVVAKKYAGQPQKLPAGILADVAPTILYLMGLPIPSTMTGTNLIRDVLK
jgi:2,3-bisphosphoglycerate-independent phosphoglycerate mutase